MSKYVKYHSISVGYNNSGQEFFDILNKYKQYVHSYFFSATETMGGGSLDPEAVLNDLKYCDTYNIPGNILFNTLKDFDHFKIIDSFMNVINLKAITLMDRFLIKQVKQRYPQLEVHLSVRYFDWNIPINPHDLLDILINDKLIQYIDVINISGARSYNDFELMKKIKDLGIKIKFIMNEGCIVNRDRNYSKLPGLEKYICGNNMCNKICDKVTIDYPWLSLARISLFKEQFQYYNIDIWKLTSRNIRSNNSIDAMLYYFTSDDITKYIRNFISLQDHYDTFLEYAKFRSTKCKGYCNECGMCEKYYNLLIGGNNDE